MQPQLRLLSDDLIAQITAEAMQLLMSPGSKVLSTAARKLLAEAGAPVDEANEVVHIPEALVRQALATAPHEFFLYDRAGNPAVRYGGDAVQFDPGSSGVNVLDPETLQHKPAQTADLVRLIKIAEMLPQYDAQSTAVVCHEVPNDIGDLYRLYLVLLHSAKPIVTGAFSTRTTQTMCDMLAIMAGGRDAFVEKPRAVFDVCPTPPLIWSEFAAQSLIDLARAAVPAEIVPVPLAGVAAPVTLLGSVVQHAAECLSGITIHQLARPGAPVVWGGAPTILDMRQGTSPMGAIETAMLNAAGAQIGKALGLPTHGYLGASDAKIVDAQAGLESSVTAMIGALAGINMISGGGMLDFLACQSPEKLIIDAEVIAMAKHLLNGLQVRTGTLAATLFAGIDFKPDFLKQKLTRQLFSQEQYLPTSIIDRGSLLAWEENGRLDAFARAKLRATELLAAYQRPALPVEQERELRQLMSGLAHHAGMDNLPAIENLL